MIMDVYDDYMDDYDFSDAYEKYDNERVDPNTPQAVHARTLVGKWCYGHDTPIYGNMLAKVISVGDNDLGQVNIITLRASKGMFQLGHWKVCGHEEEFTTTIGSTWINATDIRPSFTDWLKFIAATAVRITICKIAHERSCFKYKDWKNGMYRYHQYNPIITNMAGSFYEFLLAFKYGVYLSGWRH